MLGRRCDKQGCVQTTARKQAICSTLMYLKTLKSLRTLNALKTLIPAKPLSDTFKACNITRVIYKLHDMNQHNGLLRLRNIQVY